eukprot:3572063-Alexandrium_andersonii.AAC.1
MMIAALCCGMSSIGTRGPLAHCPGCLPLWHARCQLQRQRELSTNFCATEGAGSASATDTMA